MSPDPLYEVKLQAIAEARARAQANPKRIRVLYADEVTFYRRPDLGRNWHPRGRGGRAQPKAVHAPGANTKRRVIGAIDVFDGRVLSRTASRIGVREICRFLTQVRRSYGDEMELTLVWDNWPLHYHEEVMKAAAEARIQLLNTPTYAPWTNPIEKLWKKLRDEVLRLHRLSDAWGVLRSRVDAWLVRLQKPNPDLLRYVGLSPPLQV